MFFFLISFFFAFDLLLEGASQWIISHWPGNDELRVTLSALTPVPSANGPFLWKRQWVHLKLLAVMASCLLAHVRHACKPCTWIKAHGSTTAIYLLTVTLSLLPAPNRVKCRDEFSGAVGKVLTAGHWWLVDGQGVWVVKDWIPVSRMHQRRQFIRSYFITRITIIMTFILYCIILWLKVAGFLKRI